MRRLKMYWQMHNGLVSLTDFMGYVGFWLYRGTMKRTLGVAIALVSIMILGKGTDAFGISAKTAFTGTGMIFALSCLGGLALMMISGSISNGTLKVAEGKGSNLLEDMKKSRLPIHRDQIWSHVFVYESEFKGKEAIEAEYRELEKYEDKMKRLCDISYYQAMDDAERRHDENKLVRLGLTERGWDRMFEYAAQIPMPRALLEYRLRYDLTKVRDWYDGAPFHRTDTKLQDQFDGTDVLQHAKKASGYKKKYAYRHKMRRVTHKIWFSMITRAVQIRVTYACKELDRKYAPYHFYPDHFLWPNEDLDRVVLANLGREVLEELDETRERLFKKIFHQDKTLSHQLMQKAIYPNFAAATELRQLYDPEYVTGELKQDWSDDVHQYDRAFKQTPKAELNRQLTRRRVRTEQNELKAYLAKHEIQFDCDFEIYRAIRIAYHTNYCGLKYAIGKGLGPDAAFASRKIQFYGRHKRVDAPRIVRHIIEDAAGDVAWFSRTLQAVRLHHELTRLELEDYDYYLEQIMN